MSSYKSEALDYDVRSTEMTETIYIDRTGESAVTFAVIEAVSSVTDQAMTEMEPLETVIDTDALNTIFADRWTSDQTAPDIQFEYENCLVRVTANGEVTATAL